MPNTPSTLICSFCGKRQDQIRRLIVGPNGVFICDECVALFNSILVEEAKAPPTPPSPAPGPKHPR